jgi:glucose-1-phosphate thymidylyltransferase
VKRWTAWNEPNQRRWLRPVNPRVYVRRILNPTFAQLHRAVRGVRVAGGVTAPRGARGGVSPVAWIRGMRAARARLDVYAHNPYPERPRVETPWSGGCARCDTITMATLERLFREVGRAFGRKPIWLTEYGYQSNPPERGPLGVPLATQAAHLGSAARRVYAAARVEMLIQFLIRDDGVRGGWQSGLMTVTGRAKPAFRAFMLPLTQVSRRGTRAALWGQVRPRSGRQPYRVRVSTGRGWRWATRTRRTNARGFFSVRVRAGRGARVQIWSPRDETFSPPLRIRWAGVSAQRGPEHDRDAHEQRDPGPAHDGERSALARTRARLGHERIALGGRLPGQVVVALEHLGLVLHLALVAGHRARSYRPRLRSAAVKGVILAGGKGTRLHPLTRITNKHLLPVYDRPMVTYAIETLVRAGVNQLMLVTGGTHAGEFFRLLGDGHQYGIERLFYAYQEREGGIAEALGLAERFVAGDRVVVMLADNVVERSIRPAVEAFERQASGARILLARVPEREHLRHLGVPEFDGDGRVARIVEKPSEPPSEFAVTGIYLYDASVFGVIPELEPSGRGELEITDVNNWFIERGTMEHDVLEGFWGDAGESIDAYYAVIDFVRRHGVNR